MVHAMVYTFGLLTVFDFEFEFDYEGTKQEAEKTYYVFSVSCCINMMNYIEVTAK